MKILVISDGKYGDRAAKVIRKKFPHTQFIVIKERNVNSFIDNVNLSENLIEKIKWANLLISYVRHPDVVMEICGYKVPIIIAVDFGKGFLKQIQTINPKCIMPESMCNVKPNTGIDEIDLYFSQYGIPRYQVELDASRGEIPIIKNVKLLVESPCGASDVALDKLIGKKLIPETITSYGVNIRNECREPISVMLKHNDIADSSASLHLIQLLDALEKTAPHYFNSNKQLIEYAKKRRQEYKCLRQASDIFEE
ncbi:MAG: hypothetical protein EU541_01670 [Promethearchaeota archaeon]|nr:MAG: hypothetical protein EU541_01670 [Candidatus Lokiarchaeota archaeon]